MADQAAVADPAAPSADPLERAVETARAAARYLSVGLGAIAAALIGTLPFAGLGTAGHPVVAGIGVAVAAAGVLLALMSVASVLTPRSVDLTKLAEDTKFTKRCNDDPTLLDGYATKLSTLICDYKKAVAAYGQALKAPHALEADTADQLELLKATEKRNQLNAALTRLATLHVYERVMKRWTLARWLCGLGVVAVVAGSTTMAFATQGDQDDPEDPKVVAVGLTSAGQAALAERLGAQCVKSAVIALRTDGQGLELPVEVLTVPTPLCRAASVQITEGVGVLSRPADP